MKSNKDNCNIDSLVSTFAKMVYSDIQKYINEHLDEFEEWKREQELPLMK